MQGAFLHGSVGTLAWAKTWATSQLSWTSPPTAKRMFHHPLQSPSKTIRGEIPALDCFEPTRDISRCFRSQKPEARSQKPVARNQTLQAAPARGQPTPHYAVRALRIRTHSGCRNVHPSTKPHHIKSDHQRTRHILQKSPRSRSCLSLKLIHSCSSSK